MVLKWFENWIFFLDWHEKLLFFFLLIASKQPNGQAAWSVLKVVVHMVKQRPILHKINALSYNKY